MPLTLFATGIYFSILLWEIEERAKMPRKSPLWNVWLLRIARRRPAFLFGLFGAALIAGLEIWAVSSGRMKVAYFVPQWIAGSVFAAVMLAMVFIKQSRVLGEPSPRKSKLCNLVCIYTAAALIVIIKIYEHELSIR